MGSIRIEGDPPREIPRDPYDLRRRTVAQPKAVCHAPFSALHVGQQVAPCRHSTIDLGDPRRHSLDACFTGEAADQMRQRFRDYLVRRSECARCVHCWEDEAFAESPAQAEYDRALPPVNGVAPRLHALSVDTRVKLPEARVDEIRALVPQLDRLDLLCSDLGRKSLARALLNTVEKMRGKSRPKVRLFTFGPVPASDGLPNCVTAVEVTLPLAAPRRAAVKEALAELADELKERATPLTVRTEVGRTNWAELKGWLTDVLACGAAPTVEPIDPGDPDSLAGLDGDTLSALHGVFYRWSVELGIAQDAAKGAAPFTSFLARLRHWQLAAAGQQGEAATWSTPALDHPLLADENEARHLLQDFLRVYHSSRVEHWLSQLAHHAAFVRGARERCALRLVALWLGCVFERSDVRPALRAIYEDGPTAAGLIAADRLALAGTSIATWHDGWVKELKLELAPRASAPFEVPPARKQTRSARAQITVIIPSYNHERFIGQAIDSVLAQAGKNLKVLVVDDGSRDGTVKAARTRRDPRVRVEVNKKNLGLGESLFQALKRVRTRYVAVLNSDDLFHPARISRCLAALRKQPRAAVAATLLVPVDADGRRLTTADTSSIFDGKRVHDWLQWYEASCRGVKPKGDLLGPLLERNFLVTSSNLVCRRDFLLKLAPAWRDLEFCVDWQVFLHAAAHRRLAIVAEPLLAYRLHASNTVWFDAEREWRYYIESHRVIARTLETLIAQGPTKDPRRRFETVLELAASHLSTNGDVDWAGIYLGLLLERLKIPSRAIRGQTPKRWIQTLDSMRHLRLHMKDVVHLLGDNLSDLFRMRGERPFLRSTRNQAEAVADELERLRWELTGSLHDRANLEKLWHQAEHERDQEGAEKSALHEKIGDLERSAETALRAGEQEAARLAGELKGTEHLREHLSRQIDVLLKGHEEARRELQTALGEIQRQHQQVRHQLEQAATSDTSALPEGIAPEHGTLREQVLRERNELLAQVEQLQREAVQLHEQLERARRDLEAESARAAAELGQSRAEGLALLEAERVRLAGLLNDERSRLTLLLDAARLDFTRELETAKEAHERERTASAQDHARVLGAFEARERQLEQETRRLRSLVDQRTLERDQMRRTPEFRVGHVIVNKFKLKKPLRAIEKRLHKSKVVLADARLRAERRGWLGGGRGNGKPRVFATVCWNFPIYSQTFVYQELMQLQKRGFELRLIYSKLDPKEHLHPQFAPLWKRKRVMHLDRVVHERDYMLYKARFPDRVEEVTRKLAVACGLSRDQLTSHDNFLQSFSYTRMAEAWGADYLHSYFFYDRSLMSLIAAEVLDLPRGISCYADHVMEDYELKVVPLHMQTCDVVVATSARIKRELLTVAPGCDPDKILVKPNAIDCTRFPVIPRTEPSGTEPFRLVVTSRIEPKKGLIYLVEAVKLLRDEGLNVEAHLVGDADQGVPSSENYKAQLCELIAHHDLWGRVHLEGRQPEQGVRRFLAQSHLFLAPFVETESGDKDGIPTALVEAMATGLPSVVTDSGSITEVVDDGVDARVVPQRHPRALAHAIRALLEDPNGRKEMGWKAAQKARERFDVSVCEPLFHDRVRALLRKS